MNSPEPSIESQQKKRENAIVRTSLLGILANVLLSGFKAAVGLLSHSIAVTLDAVNNLTDALSSIITIIGAKLSGKAPDKKHPLGHGRAEYLSAWIIAALVLYAGIMSLVKSVKNILTPPAVDYTAVTIIVLVASIAIKLFLGIYVGRRGKALQSGALSASGRDALNDAILTTSVLLSAILFLVFGVQLEAYVGVVISVLIIKSGLNMLTETLNELLGKRVDRAFLDAIRQTICDDPDVRGAYDLILHSYGVGKYIGSVHVEVPDTMDADAIDHMERRIAENVYRTHGVLLTGIGIYAADTHNDAVATIRTDVTRRVMAHKGVLQIHGFHADVEQKHMCMDIILDYALDDRDAVYETILAEIREAYPSYDVQIILDIDI